MSTITLDTVQVCTDARNLVRAIHTGQAGPCHHAQDGGTACFAGIASHGTLPTSAHTMCSRCQALWHAAMSLTILTSLAVSQEVIAALTAACQTPTPTPIDLATVIGRVAPPAAPAAKPAKPTPSRPKTADDDAEAWPDEVRWPQFTQDAPAIDADASDVPPVTDEGVPAEAGTDAAAPGEPVLDDAAPVEAASDDAAPKAPRKKRVKAATTTALACSKCAREFVQRNHLTMHERFCAESTK